MKSLLPFEAGVPRRAPRRVNAARALTAASPPVEDSRSVSAPTPIAFAAGEA
jgi:hypothetical protein